MKQAWTRLSQIILKRGGNTRFMEQRFNNLFMRHHKNCCEVVLDREGRPLAAVYFTPAGKHPDALRSLMSAVRERTNALRIAGSKESHD